MRDYQSRQAVSRAAGLFGTFDDVALEAYAPRRMRVLWIEIAPLDCRMWSYYCDIRAAMAKLHDLCSPHGEGVTCYGQARNGGGGRARSLEAFQPEVAIVGPRFAINVATEDEPLGFDRAQYARLPLLVLQNKMYVPHGWREIVGDLSAKLRWVRASGTVAAFTWLSSRHLEFTNRSGIPHHFLPFGVDAVQYARHAATLGGAKQPFDVGFTGASGSDKYPLRQALITALQSMDNVSVFTGTWSQTTLNRADAKSWKAGSHEEYAALMARTKMWISTTGPESIVGTRYYEVLASGTTLLMCNQPPKGVWVYDGLFKDGEHVVMFDGVADMKSKILRYTHDQDARFRIVRNAHALAMKLHTWDMRARFISWIAEAAISRQATRPGPYYSPSASTAASTTPSLGCYAISSQSSFIAAGLADPKRSRNKRRLHRYTVSSCREACFASGARVFGVQGGGFSGGNAHMLARCYCSHTNMSVVAEHDESSPRSSRGTTQRHRHRATPMALRHVRAQKCQTTCSLLDPRPCGGAHSIALYAMGP